MWKSISDWFWEWLPITPSLLKMKQNLTVLLVKKIFLWLFNVCTEVRTQSIAKCWYNFGQGKIVFEILSGGFCYVCLTFKLTSHLWFFLWLFLLDTSEEVKLPLFFVINWITNYLAWDRGRTLSDMLISFLQNKGILGSEKLHYSKLIDTNLNCFEFLYGSYIFI